MAVGATTLIFNESILDRERLSLPCRLALSVTLLFTLLAQHLRAFPRNYRGLRL